MITGGEETTTPYEFTSIVYEDYSDEDQLCNKSSVIQFGALLTMVFFSIVVVLSLLGNSLVLVILVKYENLKSLTNIFILNLAVSDLIFTFGLPFWASYHVSGWTFEEAGCKAVSFVFYVGFYSSILFLTMMTIHRYLAVVRPLSDLGSVRGCYGVITSVIIWTVSVLAAVPVLIFRTVQSSSYDGDVLHCVYRDFGWKMIGTYQQNIFFLVSFLVISFCYTKILCTLLRSRSHTRYRTVKLIFVIVVVFFLGWAPYNLLIFLQSLTDWGIKPFTECHLSKAVDYGFYICRLIAFSHCCLNPVFYVFVGVKFRSHLKKMLKKLCQPQAINESQNRHSRFILNSNGEEISMY